MSHTTQSVNSLVFEVKQRVCRMLMYQRMREELLSLALTNREWMYAALPLLLSEIRFGDITVDFGKTTSILGGKLFDHVRATYPACSMKTEWYMTIAKECRYLNRFPSMPYNTDSTYYILGHSSTIRDLNIYSAKVGFLDDICLPSVKKYTGFFIATNDLLSAFPNLDDLTVDTDREMTVSDVKLKLKKLTIRRCCQNVPPLLFYPRWLEEFSVEEGIVLEFDSLQKYLPNEMKKLKKLKIEADKQKAPATLMYFETSFPNLSSVHLVNMKNINIIAPKLRTLRLEYCENINVVDPLLINTNIRSIYRNISLFEKFYSESKHFTGNYPLRKCDLAHFGRPHRIEILKEIKKSRPRDPPFSHLKRKMWSIGRHSILFSCEKGELVRFFRQEEVKESLKNLKTFIIEGGMPKEVIDLLESYGMRQNINSANSIVFWKEST